VLAEVWAAKRQEEVVWWLFPSSLAARPLLLGTAASFSPAFGSGEEQQGGVNPVPGHSRRGVRNKKKTTTWEEEERDAESVYADFLRTELAFHRLLVPLASSVLANVTGAGPGPSAASG